MLDVLKQLEKKVEKDMVSGTVWPAVPSVYLQTLRELQSANGALWRYVITNNHTLTSLFDYKLDFLEYADYNYELREAKAALCSDHHAGYMGMLLRCIGVEDMTLDPTEWFEYIDKEIQENSTSPMDTSIMFMYPDPESSFSESHALQKQIDSTHKVTRRAFAAKVFAQSSVEEIADYMICVDMLNIHATGGPSIRLSFSFSGSKFLKQHVDDELKHAYNKKLISVMDTNMYNDVLNLAKAGELNHSDAKSFSVEDLWEFNFGDKSGK